MKAKGSNREDTETLDDIEEKLPEQLQGEIPYRIEKVRPFPHDVLCHLAEADSNRLTVTDLRNRAEDCFGKRPGRKTIQDRCEKLENDGVVKSEKKSNGYVYWIAEKYQVPTGQGTEKRNEEEAGSDVNNAIGAELTGIVTEDRSDPPIDTVSTEAPLRKILDSEFGDLFLTGLGMIGVSGLFILSGLFLTGAGIQPSTGMIIVGIGVVAVVASVLPIGYSLARFFGVFPAN